MTTVAPTSDPPPASCPICGDRPAARSRRNNDGVIVEDYLDQAGHIWMTKWAVVG